jgi:hypothetical protein
VFDTVKIFSNIVQIGYNGKCVDMSLKEVKSIKIRVFCMPLIGNMSYDNQSLYKGSNSDANIKRILVDPTSNIRSSQRLSHACLSTYRNKVKPQKAQYNSCNFLDHIPSTWITVENLELIHALMRVPFGSRAVIRQTNHPSGCFNWWNSR